MKSLPPEVWRLVTELPPSALRTKVVEAALEFYVLERHCKVAQSALANELKELEETMTKELDGLDEHSTDGYFSSINDEYIEIAETLPRLQWYSQFLLAHSFFEKSLNDICTALREDFGYALSFKELSDQGISRARNYLVKVCGVSEPFETEGWRAAKMFGDIRNAIAHRSGFIDYLPDKSDSLYAKLNSRDDVELKQEVLNQEDAQINIDDQFVVGAIGVYRAIVLEIGRSISSAS